MSLISLVITLVVVGVLLWLINTYIPMDGKIKQIINIVVVICVILWLLRLWDFRPRRRYPRAAGAVAHGGRQQVPKVRPCGILPPSRQWKDTTMLHNLIPSAANCLDRKSVV